MTIQVTFLFYYHQFQFAIRIKAFPSGSPSETRGTVVEYET
jgi:hypothetical protein